MDVRVLAATHRDLKTMTAEGKFREDLLFRLRVVEIELPPLRERGGDVLLLARSFLAAGSRPGLAFSPEAERALLAWSWPGNVRELANAVERATIFCRGGLIQPDDFPGEVRGGNTAGPGGGLLAWWRPGEDFQEAKEKLIDVFEREVLTAVLREHRGNLSQAARELGIHRQNLLQKLHKLGIVAEEYRS